MKKRILDAIILIFTLFLIICTAYTTGFKKQLEPVATVTLVKQSGMKSGDTIYLIPVSALFHENGCTYIYLLKENITVLGEQDVVNKIAVTLLPINSDGKTAQVSTHSGIPDGTFIVESASCALSANEDVSVKFDKGGK